MANVEFTKDNSMKCTCGTCPVQVHSACVADKGAKIMAAMESSMEGMPAAEDFPGLYCSTGVASCGDLDLAMGCICSGCPVFTDNELSQWKYCDRGSATRIG